MFCKEKEINVGSFLAEGPLRRPNDVIYLIYLHGTYIRFKIPFAAFCLPVISCLVIICCLYVHRTFFHKHLVRLFGVCSKTKPLCIITELMCNGEFLD